MANTDRTTREIVDGRWAVVGGSKDGGMASVVEAFDLEGEFGQVALKMLAAGSEDKWRRAAFEKEQEAIARLSHPNIVRLLASGRDSDRRYLVFPWYATRLDEHLKQTGPLPWAPWWEQLGQPILSALELSHRQSVVHRDLKPANILLDDDGQPVVIDFGIAKLQHKLAPELTVRGQSRPFTPPEDDTPAVYMAGRDAFSWAALSVFAVSGADPYPDDERSPDDVLADALAQARDALPKALLPPLERCLSSDPAARPASAGVLLADLEDALTRETRARAAASGAEAPLVHLRVTRSAHEGLGVERDLYAAQVDALIQRDLEGEHAVLPFIGEEDHYRVVGTELSLHVAVDEDGSSLAVLKAISLPDSALERDRDAGWPGPVRFAAARPRELAAAADAISHLRNEVVAHAAERRAEDRRRARAYPLSVWRTLLSLQKSLQAAEEDPLSYVSTRVTRHGLAFELRGVASSGLIGQRRLARLDGGGEFVGEVVHVKPGEVVTRTISGHASDVLASGELRLDMRAGGVNLERQQRALDAVEYRRARRADLVDLLGEPAGARAPRPMAGLRFSAALDQAKQRAIAAALGCEDILLVHGPPGTGKTRFIRELVLQTLYADPDARILIASQAHVALDNALREVRAADPTFRLLRVARPQDERVDPNVSDLLLDRNLAAWRERVIAQGHAWLHKWATDAGVDAGDVEATMRMRELAASLERADEIELRLAQENSHLNELRGATRRASQAATTSTLIRELAAEVEELGEGLAAAQAAARDHRTRLVEIGHLARGTNLRELSAHELRDRAAALLPADREAGARCEDLIALLADWHARFGTREEFGAAALLRAQVVGATCVGLAGVRGVEQVPFDLCIVDEASRASATETLIPLALARRVVLVGDDRQLPPYVDEALRSQAVLEQHGLTREDVSRSLFGDLARQLPRANVIELTHQHRMHPAIGRLVSERFYGGRLTSEPRETLRTLASLAPQPVTWLTTLELEGRRERREGASVANDLEARVIRAFLEAAEGLARAAGKKLSVAVLSAYGAQCELLSRRLEGSVGGWSSLAVECHTVDAYQGHQADVVLYSVTRSNRDGQIGFLRESPRLNVALSRARDLLVIVGDHGFVHEAHHGRELQRVLDHVEADPDCCLLGASEP